MKHTLTLLIALCLWLACGLPQSAQANPQGNATMLITIGNTAFSVELYDTQAAKSLRKQLPQTIRMHSWGNEYYGELSGRIDTTGDAMRDVFAVGEVALGPAGNALCIFFGPTPASVGDEPRMASDGVPLGKITGDISALKKLKGSLGHVRLAEQHP